MRSLQALALGAALVAVFSSACAPNATPAFTSTRLPPSTTAPPVVRVTASATHGFTPSATALLPTSTPSAPNATPTLAEVAPIIALTYPSPADMYAVVNVASDDVLNVRADAGTSHAIVTTLPPSALGIQITGPAVEADGAQWVPILSQQNTGWVNREYLALQYGTMEDGLVRRGAEVIQLLRRNDFQALAQWVHPLTGVRFSPYAYINAPDLVFSHTQMAALPADSTVYRWGYFDGSGLPIELTFTDYVKRFVYDVDFARPQVIGFNRLIALGNSLSNLAEVYPNAQFIEYHIADLDPAVDEFDWRSLRLVFEAYQGEWFLVGVIHTEWTI